MPAAFCLVTPIKPLSNIDSAASFPTFSAASLMTALPMLRAASFVAIAAPPAEGINTPTPSPIAFAVSIFSIASAAFLASSGEYPLFIRFAATLCFTSCFSSHIPTPGTL